jgi:hypothetical protein
VAELPPPKWFNKATLGPVAPSRRKTVLEALAVLGPAFIGLWASLSGKPHPRIAAVAFLVAVLIFEWFVLDFFKRPRSNHVALALLTAILAAPFLRAAWREAPPSFPTAQEIADATIKKFDDTFRRPPLLPPQPPADLRATPTPPVPSVSPTVVPAESRASRATRKPHVSKRKRPPVYHLAIYRNGPPFDRCHPDIRLIKKHAPSDDNICLSDGPISVPQRSIGKQEGAPDITYLQWWVVNDSGAPLAGCACSEALEGIAQAGTDSQTQGWTQAVQQAIAQALTQVLTRQATQAQQGIQR